MLMQEALPLDLNISFLDSDKSCSVGKISGNFFIGDITSYNDVLEFGRKMDIVTIEIENVNTQALEELESSGICVYPQSGIIKIIKDKGLQKEFLKNNEFPSSEFELCESVGDILQKIKSNTLSFPFVQKLRTGGYDGKGVCIIRSFQDIDKLLQGPSIVEKLADIDKELSVIAVRSSVGEVTCYPSVSMDFHPTANLVQYLICPSGISEELELLVQQLAKNIVNKLQIVGLLAIELFLNKDGSIWVNELAPRPHNSGHHTLVNGSVSQYENHLRAILGLPLGNTSGKVRALMMNVLGEEGFFGKAVYSGFEELLKTKGVHPYLYGKLETKPFRKMGHITITDSSIEECIRKYYILKEKFKIVSLQ
ncbi:MAG: 5-(carboxyamino)imidazole ribonucleotide synthase [Saprospiraceae bacterium]|nr:5-(carboxyamino)imidazole ribonucleotide synthase [Saprospiraceae bacterium]